jgi:cobaltochelatase CobS
MQTQATSTKTNSIPALFNEEAMTAINFKPYNFKQLRAGAVTHPTWAVWASRNGTNAANASKADLVRFHLEAFHNDADFMTHMTEALRSFTDDEATEATEAKPAPQPAPQATQKPTQEKPKPMAQTPATTTQDAPHAAGRLAAAIAELMAEGGKAAPLDVDQVREIVKLEVAAVATKALEGFSRVQITILDQAKQESRQVEGLTHKSFPALLKACAAVDQAGNHLNVWMHGPAGSGKTHAAAQVAKALNLPFGFHGSMSMPHELVGFVDAAGKYHTTQFVKRFTEGGLCLLDEVDSGENGPLLALQAALANGDMSLPNGEIVKRHKDFICIAAGNTTGQGATVDYVGRSKIDAAFLSRFPILISWGYDEELEQAFSGNKEFAMTVQAARAKAKALGIKALITPRHTAAGAALIAMGATAKEAALATYLSALSAEQVALMQKGA